MLKVCKKCELPKEEKSFALRSDTGRRRGVCTTCRKSPSRDPAKQRKYKRDHYYRHLENNQARSRAWNQAHPEQRFETSLRHRFGISSKDFETLLTQQEGVCAACRLPETAVDRRTRKVRRLHIDHDHETGVIRGLLCTRCNLAVGYLKDDPRRAEGVLSYLRESQRAPFPPYTTLDRPVGPG